MTKNIISFFAFLLLLTPHVNAQEANSVRDIHIENPYAFATMPGATTGAAFMKIYNRGSEDDKIVKVKSSIAKINELHENLIDPDDGKMMMRKVRHIDVPKDGVVDLHPKGHHVMFIKMKEPLILGTFIEITLKFKKSGTYRVTLPVVQPGMVPEAKQENPLDKKAEDHHDMVNPTYFSDDKLRDNPVYKRIK